MLENLKERLKVEEYYEKCRALLSVLNRDDLSESDRDAMLWILSDNFEALGNLMGIVLSK